MRNNKHTWRKLTPITTPELNLRGLSIESQCWIVWNALKESTDGRSSRKGAREKERKTTREKKRERRDREKKEKERWNRRMRIEKRRCWSAQSIHPATDSNRSKATVRPDGWFIRPVMSSVPVYLTFPFVPRHTLLSKLLLPFNFLPAAEGRLCRYSAACVQRQAGKILIIKIIRKRLATIYMCADWYRSLHHLILILIKIIISPQSEKRRYVVHEERRFSHQEKLPLLKKLLQTFYTQIFLDNR